MHIKKANDVGLYIANTCNEDIFTFDEYDIN